MYDRGSATGSATGMAMSAWSCASWFGIAVDWAFGRCSSFFSTWSSSSGP